MAEYIMRESGYPGRLETEIVGELTRCKDCKLFGDEKCLMYFDGYDWAEPDGYCHLAERREEGEADG